MLKLNGRRLMLAALLAGGSLAGVGCRQDMHDNPRYEPYEVGSHREIPEGTVSRGSLAINPDAPKVVSQAAAPMPDGAPMGAPAPGAPSSGAGAGAGAGAAAGATPVVAAIPVGEDGFPFKITKEILDRGQNRFNISCLPCHGALGDGNGMIAMRGIRRPPSYHIDRLRKAPSSYYYDVITNGFGAMSNYADQLNQEDRWKVIAYIRVLQLSQKADAGLLSESDRHKLDEAEHEAAGKSGKTDAHQTAGGHSNQ
jgi:mono/diheme cytochrome c family protein